jgi:AcrR family transcriptional regulator
LPPKGKKSAYERLLQAAEDLAWEAGAGNLTLDAVAARAGVSKGGLLYHFPSKQKLMEALVERYIEHFNDDLTGREIAHENSSNATARAYLEMFMEETKCDRPPPSGVLAALAENPSYLNPIRAHHREMLDRMKASANDPTVALIVFLTVQGIKSMELLTMGTLSAVSKLEEMLS